MFFLSPPEHLSTLNIKFICWPINSDLLNLSWIIKIMLHTQPIKAAKASYPRSLMNQILPYLSYLSYSSTWHQQARDHVPPLSCPILSITAGLLLLFFSPFYPWGPQQTGSNQGSQIICLSQLIKRLFSILLPEIADRE